MKRAENTRTFSAILLAGVCFCLSLLLPQPSQGAVELPEEASAGWWSKVSKGIEAAGYQTRDTDSPNGTVFDASNSAKGLRTRFTQQGIEVTPRDTEKTDWRGG